MVVRPFHLSWQAAGIETSRTARLIRKVLDLNAQQVATELEIVYRDFGERHWQIRDIFERRFHNLADELQTIGDVRLADLGGAQRELIGAYFCHEYSYAAAALMNPSIVPHPDQTGLTEGQLRFVMSLRAVGEGHISSICFREGIVGVDRHLSLQPEPPFATAAYRRDDEIARRSPRVTVHRHHDSSLSGTVIFPVTEAQSNGLEDLRLTQFDHAGGAHDWIGTYTAYNGNAIRSEMLRTADFRSFELLPMSGTAAVNKGMGLFPRKIGGQYCMIGRQDGENLFLIRSDNLTHWDEGTKLIEPVYPWEFIQIGNCGAPIEIDEGWLVLTHGVGAMRKYSVGAMLLDKDDPSKVLCRTAQPILSASSEDRDGYVPNVVYTCGALVVGQDLFIPYGIADSSVGFAFAPLKTLIGAFC
ncbi:glycoside hydrolase family 130 protein [soil metagenome]